MTTPHEKPAVEPPPCPDCGSRDVARILYGMPAFTPDQMRDERAGRIHFGGCCVGPGMPRFRCNACRCAWGALGDDD